MNELALFAGAGGGLLASQWLKRWKTICYVEWAEYPARIIEARIRDGILDDAPIWDDVKTFDGIPWRGFVDVITAGFPCQPFSQAGKRESNNDMRNGWPHTIRIINEVKPKYILLENVTGLLSAVDKSAEKPIPYFGTILRELAESGYDARWRVLSAAEMGAPHKRDRLWIACANREHARRNAAKIIRGFSKRDVDYKKREESARKSKGLGTPARKSTNKKGDVSNSDKSRFSSATREQLESIQGEIKEPKRRESGGGATTPPGGDWWFIEPELDRVVDGMADRVDRIKAIGNGQVPLVASTAWDMLT